MGDFNCRLDRDAKHVAPKIVGAGAYDRVPTSENGLGVLGFCKTNNLRDWNMWFERSAVRRYTWYHPATNMEAMLDLVLGREGKNACCCFKDVRVCRSAEGAASDLDELTKQNQENEAAAHPDEATIGIRCNC